MKAFGTSIAPCKQRQLPHGGTPDSSAQESPPDWYCTALYQKRYPIPSTISRVRSRRRRCRDAKADQWRLIDTPCKWPEAANAKLRASSEQSKKRNKDRLRISAQRSPSNTHDNGRKQQRHSLNPPTHTRAALLNRESSQGFQIAGPKPPGPDVRRRVNWPIRHCVLNEWAISLQIVIQCRRTGSRIHQDMAIQVQYHGREQTREWEFRIEDVAWLNAEDKMPGKLVLLSLVRLCRCGRVNPRLRPG